MCVCEATAGYPRLRGPTSHIYMHLICRVLRALPPFEEGLEVLFVSHTARQFGPRVTPYLYRVAYLHKCTSLAAFSVRCRRSKKVSRSRRVNPRVNPRSRRWLGLTLTLKVLCSY